MKKIIMVFILFALLFSLVVIAVNITPVQKYNIEMMLDDDSVIVSTGDKEYLYTLEKNLSKNPKDKYICLGCERPLK